MKKTSLFLICFVNIFFVNTAFAETAPNQNWAVRYNSPANGYDLGSKVVTDNLRNVYVTGTSNNDITTIKYDANGTQQWIARYDNGNVDTSEDIAVDSVGNVYVTGSSYNNNISGNDFLTIKYNANGNQLWASRNMEGEFATALSLDSQGNVYVTGIGLSADKSNYDYITVKYDANGTQQWIARYDNGRYDAPVDIKVDFSGNIYVAGNSSDRVTGNLQFLAIKYDTSGNQLWAQRYETGPFNNLTALVLGSDGTVYVTGISYDSEFINSSYLTIRYATNGDQLWAVRYDGAPRNSANALAVDSSGNVYVTGRSPAQGINQEYTTIKYDDHGNQIWIAKEAGVGQNPTTHIAIDSLGNIYVTGDRDNSIFTLKYDKDGNLLWKIQYIRSGLGRVGSFTIDDSGNIYTTGQEWGGVSRYDFLTLKYVPSTPLVFWSQVKNAQNNWSLRKTYGTTNKPSDDVIKKVPNDWALHVTNTKDSGGNDVSLDGFLWYQVQDATDDATGWMAGKSLSTGEVYLDYDASAQADLEQKASTQLTTKAARVPVLLSAVDNYHTQSNTSNSLYAGGGGLDGRDNFQQFIQGSAFPKELVLAIASVESGLADFNNEVCSGSRDGGIGIMQITSSGFKGLGSALRNNPKLNDCLASSGWVGSLSKYYSNASQALYANIKDGYRVLQEKYSPKCPAADRVIGGLTFTCQDVEKVLTIWGYNGKVLAGNYLRLVSNALRDLSSYVGITYANNDQFVEKLKIANANRIEFKKFSPTEIEVVDSQGRVTGFDGTPVIREEIPFSRYDREADGGVIFFPQNPYTYRIIGTGTGTYGFRVEFTKDDALRTFYATNIPIVTGEIHEYLIDWDTLDRGERGVTVYIDTDGNGIADRTVYSDSILTEIEPPIISITSPAGEYILNSQTPIQFTATDAISGTATVTAKLNGTSVNNGQTVTLTKSGTNALEVTAMDNEGNTAQATSTFQVFYTASGFLPPIKADGTGTYNQGSTLPVKFTLIDAYGNPVPNVVARLYVAKINNDTIGPDEISISSTPANIGNQFRYDTIGRLYIFNLSTDAMSFGKWQLKAVLDSGQIITAVISIK